MQFYTESESFTPATIKLYTKYNNVKATYNLQAKSITLPINANGEYYTFNDEKFFVCDGEGALYYKDYIHFLNFEKLDTFALDTFLLQGVYPPHTNTKQKRLIQDFVKIYDKNIALNKLYLNPLFFAEKEQELVDFDSLPF